LGWKKTSKKILSEKGKDGSSGKYMKLKKLIKKLWKVY
jgi:hypothetical protein